MANFHDFGIGRVPTTGDDVLFLDSNFIIAYLIENHEFHLPCANFLMHVYAVNKNMLTISEITISEVMFGLARAFFTEDEIVNFRTINGREPNWSEDRSLKGSWNTIIKRDAARHKYYNEIAANIFTPFLYLQQKLKMIHMMFQL